MCLVLFVVWFCFNLQKIISGWPLRFFLSSPSHSKLAVKKLPSHFWLFLYDQRLLFFSLLFISFRCYSQMGLLKLLSFLLFLA